MLSVYAIINEVERCVYIGATTQAPLARWRQHQSKLRHGRHVNKPLQGVWNDAVRVGATGEGTGVRLARANHLSSDMNNVLGRETYILPALVGPLEAARERRLFGR